MKKLLLFLILSLLTTTLYAANQYRTRPNQYTGKPDFILGTDSLEVVDLTATGTVSGPTVITDGETLTAPSDTAYGASWNAVTGIAPSKNAVYDTFGATPGGSLGGTWASPTIDADGINDTHIDWGSGTNQVDLADIPGGISGASVWDFGGATSIEIVNSATPTTDATGEIALDTTITDHQPLWQYYDGGENMSIIAIDTTELPALDNEIIKYDAATDKFVLEADAGGAGSPGGADTQVQFNDASSFGGDADFTWNKTTNALTIASGGTFGIGTTTLNETTGATDSGGYLVGLFDEFAFSAGTDVQTVMDDLDAAIPDYYQYTLLPESAVLDDNNPPAITVIESSGTGTPRFRVADFDGGSTNEIIYWTFTVPDDMATGNWLAVVSWYTNTTTAGNTVWGCHLSATTSGDIDTMAEQAVATENTATGAVNTTEANRLIQTTITISNLDNVAASDIVTIEFHRDASDTTNDTNTVDARLVAVQLKIPRS